MWKNICMLSMPWYSQLQWSWSAPNLSHQFPKTVIFYNCTCQISIWASCFLTSTSSAAIFSWAHCVRHSSLHSLGTASVMISSYFYIGLLLYKSNGNIEVFHFLNLQGKINILFTFPPRNTFSLHVFQGKSSCYLHLLRVWILSAYCCL